LSRENNKISIDDITRQKITLNNIQPAKVLLYELNFIDAVKKTRHTNLVDGTCLHKHPSRRILKLFHLQKCSGKIRKK